MKDLSPELKAMLAKSAKERKQRRSYAVTKDQRFLSRLAKKLADKPRSRPERTDQVPAECCGTNGLRPNWHGRAS